MISVTAGNPAGEPERDADRWLPFRWQARTVVLTEAAGAAVFRRAPIIRRG